MTVRLVGLSVEEIEMLCKLPLVTETERFYVGSRWLWARLPTLRFEHAGEFLALNCKTLVHTFGKTHEEAVNQHYGPPGPGGNHFIYQWLKPGNY